MKKSKREQEKVKGKSLPSTLYCYVVKIGNNWDTSYMTKIFSTLEKAKAMMPKGFKEIPVGGYLFYAENSRKRQWFNIKSYEVE